VIQKKIDCKGGHPPNWGVVEPLGGIHYPLPTVGIKPIQRRARLAWDSLTRFV